MEEGVLNENWLCTFPRYSLRILMLTLFVDIFVLKQFSEMLTYYIGYFFNCRCHLLAQAGHRFRQET